MTIIISGVVVYLDVCVLKLALFYALSVLFYVYSQVFLRPVTYKHTAKGHNYNRDSGCL